jgi:hypothetical protein
MRQLQLQVLVKAAACSRVHPQTWLRILLLAALLQQLARLLHSQMMQHLM